MKIQKKCYFCRHNIENIDIFDSLFLKKFTTNWAKIKAKKYSGVCSKHQKELAKTIKRARFLALMPFISR
ncbi:30S ribosomal protein S18 [Candidatus Berkelbacteria bacterium CG10_big_fil_rev_8_21_14_0_10_33_10]|uniref:Small ribosomal subunit protein bS18 n=1 Tax=Candidatus Berkelbacteria bacterium CG_4_10_14_0_2_um_filter_35_9_33_12 TaxID=1974499 RepID=A0A2M7W466_9BACT|nr:MAG: 30S ribosomal protein S18 [Candidatus Berkelbacteria bacterium CG23_combo_of_CG06-09_8_20_14_all_33_15]PIS08506.1 MAG: 30S ribosomal protein S18 [Candidatus Berkelbacteria bacterium CG10_big_fil_rev_8_21_14_0_10_33_10]PJA20459.1 MAG: 30S ribosomal protein S18 [Candidatus Berkelbacteria bacterium CG_4_10_14_0_2_um_filter_35_9_33_12]